MGVSRNLDLCADISAAMVGFGPNSGLMDGSTQLFFCADEFCSIIDILDFVGELLNLGATLISVSMLGSVFIVYTGIV